MFTNHGPHIESKEIVAYLNAAKPLKKTNPLRDGKTATIRFFEKLSFGYSSCWYWRGSLNRFGYGCLRNQKAHRVSWNMFNGPVPAGMLVLHKCDVRNCVNPDHLFLGSQKDNMIDAKRKGRLVFPKKRFGESNPMAKLNNNIVRQIRIEAAQSDITQAALARKYDVSPMTINRVINYKLWRT